jgi:hypothetical protein
VAATLAGSLLALPVTAQAAVPMPALETAPQQAEIAVTPGGFTGVVPVSPGRSVLLAVELPIRLYVLITWVRDLETGRMFAAHGMRTLVTVVRG